MYQTISMLTFERIIDFIYIRGWQHYGTRKNIEVYALITSKSYHVQNGELKSDSGGEQVARFTFEGEKIVSYKDETIAVLMEKFLPTKELYNKYRKIDNTNLWKEIDKEVKEHYSYIQKKEDNMGIIEIETDDINNGNIINDVIIP